MKRFDLKALRKKEKFSQFDFGKKIGVSLAVVSNIELGKSAITEEIKEKIAAAFNIDFDQYEKDYITHRRTSEAMLPNPTLLEEAKNIYVAGNAVTLELLEQLKECQKENKELYLQIMELKDTIAEILSADKGSRCAAAC